MILGIVLTIVVVLAAPKLLNRDGGDGFFRPKPDPDARPQVDAGGSDAEPVVADDAAAGDDDAGDGAIAARDGDAATPAARDYDFYELLPGQEVAMTDAELAASARAEEARARRQQQADAADAALPQPIDGPNPDAATPATAAAPATATAATSTTASAATTAATAAGDGARYLLQAGSFSASGDAESLKARIALLGLSARVESGEAGGRTVYRVRMGPYGTASELAEAKQKLGNGGLPALAIRSN